MVICGWIMMCFFTLSVLTRLLTRFIPVTLGGIDDTLSGLSMVSSLPVSRGSSDMRSSLESHRQPPFTSQHRTASDSINAPSHLPPSRHMPNPTVSTPISPCIFNQEEVSKLSEITSRSIVADTLAVTPTLICRARFWFYWYHWWCRSSGADTIKMPPTSSSSSRSTSPNPLSSSSSFAFPLLARSSGSAWVSSS